VRRIGVLISGDENEPVYKLQLSAFTQALADLGALIWGSARAAFKSLFNFSTIQAGVFLGAPMPNHESASEPGRNSATVGDVGQRFRACLRGHRQRPQAASLDVFDRGRHWAKVDLHLPSNEIGER
jgi:hypothetical protein